MYLITGILYFAKIKCQICNKKSNLKRVVLHPLAATIDHIIPLSQGRENSYKNAQLACRRCNSTVKGGNVYPGGEQLLLFGV